MSANNPVIVLYVCKAGTCNQNMACECGDIVYFTIFSCHLTGISFDII